MCVTFWTTKRNGLLTRDSVSCTGNSVFNAHVSLGEQKFEDDSGAIDPRFISCHKSKTDL